jgi:hypothetical protein
MKVITVWQPWAQLLAEGKKYEETRSWKTNYRGEILIHAAMKCPLDGLLMMMSAETRHLVFKALGRTEEVVNWKETFPTGAIIGKAKLTDCRLIDENYNEFVRTLCPAEYAFGDFTVGRYAWVMEEAVLFNKPIPAAGKQGLWNWEGELL